MKKAVCVFALCLVWMGLAMTSMAELQNAAFHADGDASSNYGGEGSTRSWEDSLDEVENDYGWHSTGSTVDQWWYTDLGAVIPIHSIKVVARIGYPHRIRDCRVEVYESADATGTPVYTNTIAMPNGADETFTLPPATYGRSVKIHFPGDFGDAINHTEVYVYSENLAYGKPTTSSGYIQTDSPDNVVDGTRPAPHPDIFHANSVNGWFQIDLETVFELDAVRLWNRNANKDRLADMNMQILAEDGTTVLYDYLVEKDALINPANVLGSPNVITLDLRTDQVTGRYVKITRAANPLQVSEVEVYGGGLISNRRPSDLATTGATFNGYLAGTNTSTDVRVYWGTTDEGTNWTQWANEHLLTGATTGEVSYAASGLKVGTEYYYRFHGSNATRVGWAHRSERFWTLPISGDPALWLDAGMLDLSNGDAVAIWADRSGSGNDASQVTTSLQPAYSAAGFNGGPSVQFDGGDYLDLGSVTNLDAFEIFAVVKASADGIVLGSQIGDEQIRVRNSGQLSAYVGTGTEASSDGLTASTSDAFIAAYSRSGTLMSFQENGASRGTDVTIDADTLDINRVGNNGTVYLNGDIAEVIVYNRTLTEAERIQMGLYLSRKHGIASHYTTETRPTSVSGLELWFDADTIHGASDGQDVPIWYDLSGNNRTGTQNSVNSGLYQSDVINGKPVVRMDGDSTDYFKFDRLTNIRTVFWVGAEDPAATSHQGFLLGDNAEFHFHRHRNVGPDGHYYMFDASWAALMVNGETYLDGLEIDATVTEMPTNASLLSVRTSGNAIASSLSNDRGGGGRNWEGDVAELLIYNRLLTDNEQNEIGYYLANKYGLSTSYTAVDNADGATDITQTEATLNGNLTGASGESTTVKVFWGTSDGGTNAASWGNTNSFADVTEATSFSTNLTSLSPATVYYYRYYMTNDVDDGWAQDTVMFETDFSSVTNGLILWLDAATLGMHTNGQLVSDWLDQSDSGNDAIQATAGSQPEYVTNVIGGKAAVRVAAGKSLNLSSSIPPASKTVILVHQQAASQNNYHNSLGGNLHTTRPGGVWSLTISGGAFNVATTVSSRDFSINVLQLTVGDYKLWINGGLAASSANTSGLDPFNQVGGNFLGDYAEVIIYDRELTDDERNEIGLYLAQKYSISSGYTDETRPTSIANLELWWDADSLLGAGNGDDVTTWYDLSGNSKNGTQNSANSGLLYTNGINGKPVVRMDGADAHYFKLPSRISTVRTIFWVGAEDPDATGQRVLLGDSSTYDFHRHSTVGPGGHNYMWHSSHAPLMFNGETYLDGLEIDGRVTEMPTNASLISIRTSGNADVNQVSRDRGQGGRNWYGDVSELLLYSRVLTDHEINEIGYYLADKYGLSTSYSAVDNADGATDIAQTSATLNGNLTYAHDLPTTVKVFWGTSDGGSDAASWGNTNTFADVTEASSFATNLTSLSTATMYYYRYYMTNAVDDGWAQETASFRTPFGSVTNGLTLWLDASSLTSHTDGQAVSEWPDWSTSGNDASQAAGGSQPVYRDSGLNGAPSVEFDGSDYLDLSSTMNLDAYEIFAVARTSSDGMVLGTSSGNEQVRVRNGGTRLSSYVGAGPEAQSDGLTTPTSDAFIAVYSRSGTSISFEENGVSRGTKSINGATLDINRVGNMGTLYMNGDMPEVIVFNRTLTEDERNEVGYYLAEKYGITTTYTSIDNADGATDVDQTSATLNGNLIYTGSRATTVKVFWGPSDGGTNAASWANTNTFADVTEATSFSTNVTSLEAGYPYYYRFYMTNSAAEVWAQESAHLQIPMTITNGLALWYDAGSLATQANGSQVATWSDLSGNGRHVTQSDTARRPLLDTAGIGGRPAVNFDGSNDRLLRTAADMSAREIFAVVVSDSNSGFDTVLSRAADSLSLRADGGAYKDNEANDFPASGGLRQNNVVTLTKTIGENVILHADAGGLKTFTNFMVGDQNQHDRYWHGDIAEIIIFDRALTTGERSTIGTYLAEKYAIDALYPATPLPDEVNDPVLWWDADSLKGLTNSESVTTWNDMSGNDNHGTAATADSGLYYTNVINGKPVVRMDGAANHHFNFATGLSDIRSVFWVVKEDPAASNTRFLLGYNGANTYHFHRNNKFIWHGTYTHANIKNGVTSIDGTPVNGLTTVIPTDNHSIISLLTEGNVSANNFTQDRGGTTRHWQGDAAELIIYDRKLTELEEGQVGYYLEQKYGLSGAYAQVDNADGATATTAEEATLNGRVFATPSSEDSTVKVLWGTSDGGATLAWDHVDTVGIATNPAAFAFTASNLTAATTYYYRFYLTNSVDGGVFAESTELFKSSLAVTNGLEIWLDAETLLVDHVNGASVTTWEDFSGNGRHVSQSDSARKPVLNTTGIGGKPAVDFDGTNDRLFRNGANISGREIFAVVVTDSNSGFDTVLSRAADSLSLRANGGAYKVDESNDFPWGGELRQNNAVTLTKTIGQNVILHADAGSAKSFVNFMVGDQNQNNRYWDGDIAEIIIFDRELSQDERTTIGLYLAEKYSINSGYTAAQLPNDVDDPTLWYDADSIVGISDGASVSRWYDMSGNGYTATENAANSGIYHTNAFNGKPMIRFDGAASHYYNFPRVSGIRTVFWVIEEDSAASGGRFLLGDSSAWNFHRGLNNKKIWYTHDGSKPAHLGVTRLNGTQVNGTSTVLPQDQPTIVSLVTPVTDPAQANRLVNDRGSAVRNWQGDFAELIIYQRELSEFEEAQVGAYLEHKYGLSTDYVQVDNGAGASLVTTNSATLNGRLLRAPASEETTVKVLWGTSDGGSTLAWDHVDTVGSVTNPTEFAFSATNLSAGTAYYYRYYVTNSVDGGVYAESTEQFSTDLSVTNGLVLWLNAGSLGLLDSGDTVQTWDDGSCSGNDAVQVTAGSRPEYVTNVIGGEAVVRFASGKSMNLSSSIPAASETESSTVILVRKQAAAQGVWTTGLGGNTHFAKAGGTWTLTRSGGSGVLIQPAISSLEFAVNVHQLTYGDYKLWVNGDLAGAHAKDADLAAFNRVGNGFIGDYAEVIIYDRELTDEERNELGIHLSDKYGIAGGFTRTTPLPAGVDDPAIWYDADSITGIDDGASVETWRDISGNGVHATEANANSGIYYTNVINGKPVVRFDGAGTHYYEFAENTTIRTVFWVGLENPAATGHQGFLLGHDDNLTYDFHRSATSGPGGHKYIWDASNAPLMTNGKTDLNGTEIDGRVMEMPTSASILTVGTSGDASANRLVRDRTGTDRNWKGDIAELLIYSRVLSDYEKGQVGYYLEEKYGLDTEYAKISNADGATSITPTSATLNGQLYDTDDGESTEVKVFWGETDGGAAFGGWDKTGAVATVTIADDTIYTLPVTDLTPKIAYYYRFYASNSVSGSVWAESASAFRAKFTYASHNMMLWLDAETSGLTDGQSVSTWRDISGNGRHVHQLDPTRQPTFAATGFNGLPSLDFDGTSDRIAAAGVNMPAREIIVVTIADASSDWRNLVSNGADGKNIRAFDGTYRDIQAADFAMGGLFRQNEAYDLNVYIGGRRQIRAVASSQQTYGSFMIGDNGTHDRYWDGDIAEVIVYDKALTSTGRAEIHQYLRDKYNIAPGSLFMFR